MYIRDSFNVDTVWQHGNVGPLCVPSTAKQSLATPQMHYNRVPRLSTALFSHVPALGGSPHPMRGLAAGVMSVARGPCLRTHSLSCDPRSASAAGWAAQAWLGHAPRSPGTGLLSRARGSPCVRTRPCGCTASEFMLPTDRPPRRLSLGTSSRWGGLTRAGMQLGLKSAAVEGPATGATEICVRPLCPVSSRGSRRMCGPGFIDPTRI